MLRIDRFEHFLQPSDGKRLHFAIRPRQGKIIAGVCAGLARRFGISVTLIRVAFVVFAVTGVGELVYLILWVVMPKAPE